MVRKTLFNYGLQVAPSTPYTSGTELSGAASVGSMPKVTP